MKNQRIFGEIENIYEGDSFESRVDLSRSHVHKPIQAGISGSEVEGADSIVISGGYEDDEDHGDTIVYTGHGGRSNESKNQVADQTLTRGNKALAISSENKLPVRVIRGAHKGSKFGPETGYRYDGLFYVTEYWWDKGKNNHIIWRYRLEKIERVHKEYLYLDEEISLNYKPVSIFSETTRKEYKVNRIVRETKTAAYVKRLYKNTCQICRLQIVTPVSFYSEAAHIKALGRPHNGPDVIENILCLCPNHHTMLDLGIISIDDDFSVSGFDIGQLHVHPDHNVDMSYIKYHREHHFKGNSNV